MSESEREGGREFGAERRLESMQMKRTREKVRNGRRRRRRRGKCAEKQEN